jgi:hypothetical protein
MCCFSQPVKEVSGTRIFARAVDARQLLVYEMRLVAESEVAMVLPLPVPAASREDAVQFVDLSGCPRFFADLDALFPQPLSFGAPPPARAPQAKTLAVHRVGAFVASFVPSRADFARLDPRFRLPERVWDALPEYADWGFAVFALTPGDRPEYHPMALELPRRSTDRLFFPTVHVHDGAVHATARFDHELYCQVAQGDLAGWEASAGRVGDQKLWRHGFSWLDRELRVHKRRLAGELPNRDVTVADARPLTP